MKINLEGNNPVHYTCTMFQNQNKNQMTVSELSQKVMATKSGYGHYKVEILFRGKWRSFISTDSIAYDRYNDDDAIRGHYTQKDALTSFWNEGKRKLNLR